MRSEKRKGDHAGKRTASKKLFHELALKNVKKSSRDYLIYFLTLTFSVALFYTFNSIEAQFRAFGIPDRLNFLSFAAGMMAGISVLVCFIVGFLVVYANRFMLRRRKREMGVYLTLGMEFEDINALLWRETGIIGGVSLAAGLVSGILLSQGLSFATARMIGADITDYHFVLSVKAAVASVLFFCLMFLLVYRINIRELRKMDLLDLLYADKKNEAVSGGKARDILFFALAAVMLVMGYTVIAAPDKKYFTQGLFQGIGFIGAGSILLCLSISSVLVKLYKNRKRYYYSRLHLFAVNQLGSRLKSAGLSIGVVSILICLSLSAMTIGLGAGKTFVSDADAAAPFDVSFEMREEDAEALAGSSMEQILGQKGLVLTEYLKEFAELRIYSIDGITYDIFDNSDSKKESYPVSIVGIDDYNRTLALKGIAPVTLGEQEYALNYNVAENKEKLEEFLRSGRRLEINGDTLTPAADGLYNRTYYNTNGFADGGTLIIPQRLTEGLQMKRAIGNGSFQNADSYGKLNAGSLKLPGIIMFRTHQDLRIEMMSNILTTTYIGIYLGITFLIVAGAVLALQQLSQAADNGYRYALLRKLGAGEADMHEALLMQLFIYFGIPFVLAVFNSVFIVAGVFADAEELSAWSVIRTGLLTGSLVAAVYGLYFWITCTGSRRILKLYKSNKL